MKVEIRVYKQYDLDLMALAAAGYSLSLMMKDAVEAYANGRLVSFYVDEADQILLTENKTFRFHFITSDPAALDMLHNCKPRFRNALCKMILRNSMVEQNLLCYFNNNDQLSLVEAGLNNKNRNTMSDAYACSTYYEDRNKSFSFAGQEHFMKDRSARVSAMKAPLVKPARQQAVFLERKKQVSDENSVTSVMSENKDIEHKVIKKPITSATTAQRTVNTTEKSTQPRPRPVFTSNTDVKTEEQDAVAQEQIEDTGNQNSTAGNSGPIGQSPSSDKKTLSDDEQDALMDLFDNII